MTYTTTGSVCGPCGHNHRTIATARRCADKHHRACRAAGGYSDRVVVRSDGHALSDAERDDLLYGETP